MLIVYHKILAFNNLLIVKAFVTYTPLSLCRVQNYTTVFPDTSSNSTHASVLVYFLCFLYFTMYIYL